MMPIDATPATSAHGLCTVGSPPMSVVVWLSIRKCPTLRDQCVRYLPVSIGESVRRRTLRAIRDVYGSFTQRRKDEDAKTQRRRRKGARKNANSSLCLCVFLFAPLRETFLTVRALDRFGLGDQTIESVGDEAFGEAGDERPDHEECERHTVFRSGIRQEVFELQNAGLLRVSRSCCCSWIRRW